MINKNCNKKDLIIQLFLFIDDFMKSLPVLWNNVWRKPKMSASEVITCFVFGIMSWYKTIKDLHWDLISYHQDLFKIPCYKNFLEAVNKHSNEALKILVVIMENNNKNSWSDNKFIDATCIKVCHNKRIFNHKVCSWVAARWMSTMWRFFWFKLHMIVDKTGNLLSFSITPWNTDDRTPVRKLSKNIKWTLIADAWYVSEELRSDLSKEWILFLSNYKKNMKVLVTKWFHNLMKLRQIVETWFWMMKCWGNLVSSYSRSIWWHLARIIYNLLSYSLSKLNFWAILPIS